MSRIQELAAACPNIDVLAYRVVEAYLRFQLGTTALDDECRDEAVDHFTAAIDTAVFSSEHPIHLKYEVFVALFGWDLQSLWHKAHQNRCYALLRAGRQAEAHDAHQYIMGMNDSIETTCCREWSIAFQEECRALHIRNGDVALSAKDYDKAIELYSTAIDLDSTVDAIFAKRCTAKLKKKLWEDALEDAQKVIELKPSSYLGYQLKHASMHGLQRYDDAIVAFNLMLSKLDCVSNSCTRELRQQYATSFEASSAIQGIIHTQLEDTPHHLLNTTTGRLCDRGTQITAFKTIPEYKELLSSTMKCPHADFQMKRVGKAVEMYFRFVMLSHRWEDNEPLMRHIEGKAIYELAPTGCMVKLQSFCRIARDAGYRWAWADTYCIDQSNNVEVQKSINSMFARYRHSALTIVYLLDVPPSSQPGTLAKSVWNKRGWTVQEFLAPNVVLFYQRDWMLYLSDDSPNHKDSPMIMQELADATGINPLNLVAFHPGMKDARQKLRWASGRMTTLPEDIAYSLFGIFGIHSHVMYGERKQNALGRLLQDIIAQSGDITCLDLVGRSSEFNSCLPADIAYYGAPPSTPPFALSEDEMQKSISSLRRDVDMERASKVYQTIYSLNAPQFSAHRLRLPCLAFAVTEVRGRRGESRQTRSTFSVKADGLRDLSITTADNLVQLSRAQPSRQSFLLVLPWDCSLLEPPDFVRPPDSSDTKNMDDWSPPASPMRTRTPVVFF